MKILRNFDACVVKSSDFLCLSEIYTFKILFSQYNKQNFIAFQMFYDFCLCCNVCCKLFPSLQHTLQQKQRFEIPRERSDAIEFDPFIGKYYWTSVSTFQDFLWLEAGKPLVKIENESFSIWQRCTSGNICSFWSFQTKLTSVWVIAATYVIVAFVCLLWWNLQLTRAIYMLHFWKGIEGIDPRVLNKIFQGVEYTNTDIQIRKYTNTA